MIVKLNFSFVILNSNLYKLNFQQIKIFFPQKVSGLNNIFHFGKAKKIKVVYIWPFVLPLVSRKIKIKETTQNFS